MEELETPIGTKEAQKLSAGTVQIKEIKIEPAKEGSQAKIVRLMCKHPDKEELLSLSNVKVKSVQGNNETISKSALWWNLDEDGNIKKNSTTATFLRVYNKNTLSDCVDLEINTEHDSSGYLCIKGY